LLPQSVAEHPVTWHTAPSASLTQRTIESALPDISTKQSPLQVTSQEAVPGQTITAPSPTSTVHEVVPGQVTRQSVPHDKLQVAFPSH